jgi:phosphate transport system permease protein
VKTATRNRIGSEAARDITLETLDGSGRTGQWKGTLFQALILSCVLIAILMLITVLTWSIVRGWPRLDLNLITNMPSRAMSSAGTSGYQSAITGSLMIMFGMVITVVPLGVSAAIYLEEFANHAKWYVKFIELNIQNLAAVPSVVFGILGLAFFVSGGLSLGPIVYAASLTLTLLVLPTIIVTSREAIRAVPQSLRQASMGLGATKWRTIWAQVLPVAVPGIITGTILSVSRAIGEAAPLIVIGVPAWHFSNPSGFDDRATALPLLIYSFSQQSAEDFKILAAAGIVLLLVLLLMMNSVAIWLRARLSSRH